MLVVEPAEGAERADAVHPSLTERREGHAADFESDMSFLASCSASANVGKEGANVIETRVEMSSPLDGRQSGIWMSGRRVPIGNGKS